MAWRALLSKPVFACIENADSPIAVLGIPLDQSGTYRPGSRFAPYKIRETSCNIELYSQLADLVIEDAGFKDYGDVILPPGDLSASLNRIEYVVKKVSSDHSGLLVFIGGEHLITYPIVKALREKIDTLIVFDAHLDMRSEYLDSYVNHATFLRKLIEEGTRVIHLGSRAYSRDELDYLKTKSIEVYRAIQIEEEPLSLSNLGRVYISIDMDVFDPSVAPGVSNPEPYGLSPRIFNRILKAIINDAEDIVAVDVVEVNPLYDTSDVTSILASKIIVEIAGLYLKKKRTI